MESFQKKSVTLRTDYMVKPMHNSYHYGKETGKI